MSQAEPHEYQALTSGIGLVDFCGRTLIELTGRDRATFLNSFCTNDVRRLTPGDGCEAFITSVQGKVLGHILVCCGEDSLVLETVPGQAEKLIAHLDRYLIREDVQIADRSTAWGELLLCGAQSASLLSSRMQAPPPTELLASAATALSDRESLPREVVVQRVDMAGPVGFLIRGAAADIRAVEDGLIAAPGAVACSFATFDVVRVEALWPLYGRDILDDNLPQEVARDRQAISFTKGCYLGQETVARIDALGHVNRTLCGLRFSGDRVPEPGTPLTAAGHGAGHVTSAVFSPRLSAPLALGFVRRGHNEPGHTLESSAGPAEVVRVAL